MKVNNTDIEKYRVIHGPFGSSGDDGMNGLFIMNVGKKTILRMLCSDSGGWDHVSVSLNEDRCPTWEEMCIVKDLFFDKTETVVQFHPKQSNHVNVHNYCLHLWKEQGVDYILPP